MKTENSCLWWLCLLSGAFTLPAVTIWLWEYLFYDEEDTESGE